MPGLKETVQYIKVFALNYQSCFGQQMCIHANIYIYIFS